MWISLRTMDLKRRALTVAAWALLVASPFILLAAVSLAIGRNAFESYPVWTDELDYWRAVFSWLHVGPNVGYSGIGELTAKIGTLSVHGISPILLYGGFGALFGWDFSSIMLANCVWVSAGALAFCLLNRPKAGVAALLSLSVMVYAPVVLYCATSMTELANYGLLLFYLAFLLRLWQARSAARGLLAEELPIAKGLGWLLLCLLTVVVCCLYRITYVGLFIPLIAVACDLRHWGHMALGALLALLIALFVYYVTALTASPFASGFLYNFLRTDTLAMAVRMFLSHAKSNLFDYFVRNTSNPMEWLQRVLYCGVAVYALLGSFVRAEKTDGKHRVRFGISWLSLIAFVMLMLPFAIVVCAYETNDRSDYRTLAPFLWLVIAGYLVRGRRLLPALYVAGCIGILAVLFTGGPVGAYGDDYRFVATPFSADMQALCAAVQADPTADDPFENSVRTDLFSLETVATLNPALGIETGWFTEDNVGRSRWILTDYLKIPLEGYELVLKNKSGSVYRLADAN